MARGGPVAVHGTPLLRRVRATMMQRTASPLRQPRVPTQMSLTSRRLFMRAHAQGGLQKRLRGRVQLVRRLALQAMTTTTILTWSQSSIQYRPR